MRGHRHGKDRQCLTDLFPGLDAHGFWDKVWIVTFRVGNITFSPESNKIHIAVPVVVLHASHHFRRCSSWHSTAKLRRVAPVNFGAPFAKFVRFTALVSTGVCSINSAVSLADPTFFI